MTSVYTELDESLEEEEEEDVQNSTFSCKVEELVLQKKARNEKKLREFKAKKKELVQQLIIEYKKTLLKDDLFEDAIAEIIAVGKCEHVIFRDNIFDHSIVDHNDHPKFQTLDRYVLLYQPLNVISTANEDINETRSLYQMIKEKLPYKYDISISYISHDVFEVTVCKNITTLSIVDTVQWWWRLMGCCDICLTYGFCPPVRSLEVFMS